MKDKQMKPLTFADILKFHENQSNRVDRIHLPFAEATKQLNTNQRPPLHCFCSCIIKLHSLFLNHVALWELFETIEISMFETLFSYTYWKELKQLDIG